MRGRAQVIAREVAGSDNVLLPLQATASLLRACVYLLGADFLLPLFTGMPRRRVLENFKSLGLLRLSLKACRKPLGTSAYHLFRKRALGLCYHLQLGVPAVLRRSAHRSRIPRRTVCTLRAGFRRV